MDGRTEDQATTLISAAASATFEKFAVEDPETGWRVRRSRAIWALYHDCHMSSPAIARVLRSALIDGGVGEDRIHGAGVSHDAIRTIVERPRP